MATKDDYIHIKCTTEEKDAIKAQADKEGRNMTSFILWACKQYSVVTGAIFKDRQNPNDVLTK